MLPQRSSAGKACRARAIQRVRHRVALEQSHQVLDLWRTQLREIAQHLRDDPFRGQIAEKGDCRTSQADSTCHPRQARPAGRGVPTVSGQLR